MPADWRWEGTLINQAPHSQAETAVDPDFGESADLYGNNGRKVLSTSTPYVERMHEADIRVTDTGAVTFHGSEQEFG